MKALTATAAHGQNPSVLAQEALTRWLAEEKGYRLNHSLGIWES
jgi:hypothetical protein